MILGFSIPLVPPQASTTASQVDLLFLYELAVSLFFTFLILVLILYFAIRYRRRPGNEVPPETHTNKGLEVTWTLVVFLILMVHFFWGAGLYVKMKRPIENAMEIHVLGKQWMWKIEHPDGIREINALHVPVGQPIKLILISQDVIHDFFIPAFRIKQDVLPGSYVTEWFTATRPGTYHLFCSQYCGTDHSKMVGEVTVLDPADFQKWRAGVVPNETPVAAGARLFNTYGCVTCHGQRAPTLAGLYRSQVHLADGSTVVADETYLRESILNATARIVAGYPPIMPSYRGQLSEEQVFQLIEYIKSLKTVRSTEPETVPTTAPAMASPATQPANYSPDQVPDFPPARQPPPIVPPPQPGDRNPANQ